MAIQFDGATRRIILTAGTVSLSVRELWSRWVDWLLIGDNSKWPIALDAIGGQDIDPSAGTKIPIYAFLRNGWRIRPQEASHALNVGDGVLLVEGGGDPFVNTLGPYVVRVNYQQPVQAISFATGGGGGGSVTPAQIWAHLIEGGITAEQFARITLAALAGRTNGIGTPTEQYLAQDHATARIAADFDASGNRTSVTLNGG